MTIALVLYLTTIPDKGKLLPSMPEPKAVITVQRHEEHRFTDRKAKIAMGATIGLLAADSAITCNNLAKGGHEQWLIGQSCGAVVGQLAANKLAFWGAAYLAHKTHHHKIERVFEWLGPAWSAAGIASSAKNGVLQ